MSANFPIQEIVGIIAGAIGVVFSIISVMGAFRAGVLKRVRLGSIEFEGKEEELKAITRQIAAAAPEGKEVPFETAQLANYYAQILAQSKVSFWFSLVFASLGFLTIIVAAFLYTDGTGTSTAAQFVAGIIMDAVAALFFVQSRNAQNAMGEFFDKLRKDRQHSESRKLCESVSSEQARDALRIHLSLHYAEVSNAEPIAKTITSLCLATNAQSET